MARSVGKVIKALREAAGVTRHALAKAAHVDPAVLARVEEQDRPGVQFATICRLADALGVPLDEIAAAASLKRGPKGSSPKGSSAHALFLTRARSARSLLERALRNLDAILDPEP